MKKGILFFSLVLLNLTTVFAQEWQIDLVTAKDIANKENKTILLVFQGSDWCAPCIKLNRDVWSTDYFKKYAQDHYVMLQADFPRKRANALPKLQAEANGKLAEKYNLRGIFPLVVVLDKTGKVLGETGYKKLTVQEYIDQLDSFIK